MAAEQTVADPNLVVIITAVSSLLTPIIGAIVWVITHQARKEATGARKEAQRAREEVATSNGHSAGAIIEGLGEWAAQHTVDDNELRATLGLKPGVAPKVRE